MGVNFRKMPSTPNLNEQLHHRKHTSIIWLAQWLLTCRWKIREFESTPVHSWWFLENPPFIWRVGIFWGRHGCSWLIRHGQTVYFRKIKIDLVVVQIWIVRSHGAQTINRMGKEAMQGKMTRSRSEAQCICIIRRSSQDIRWRGRVSGYF